MTTQNKGSKGRFVWHELSAKDVAAAKGFYGELFGWKTKEMDMGPMGTYTIVSAGDKDVGGITKVQGGAPPMWLSYCTVEDVDAAVGRAQKGGASVLVPPSDIPEVGRFAILKDKQGAVIAPFKQVQEAPESSGPPGIGEFCWTELITQDPKAARDLYTSTFGWATEDKDMGPMGTYTVLKRGDLMAAGIMKAMDPRAPSMWLTYVAVNDVDKGFERAKKLKATGLVPPSDIPGIGRFAVVTDPEGAAIALFKG